MSPPRVLEEVRHAVQEGYRDLIFRDEHMDSPKGRLEEICRLLRRNGNRDTPGWACNLRADGADAELLASMKAAGCHTVKIGVETGDPRLRALAGKPIPDETYLQVFRYARSLGLRTHAHFLLGIPGETAESIRTTVRFARRLRPTTATFGILTPFPGVPLFDEMKNSSWRSSCHRATDGFHSNAGPLPWTDGLTADELSRELRKVYREFYLHPASWGSLLPGSLNPKGLLDRARAGLEVLAFSFSDRRGG